MPVKRVLVTGAAGFAGQYLIEELLRRGYEVAGTYYRTKAPLGGGTDCVSWHRCDVRRGECVRRVVRDFRPDGVVHLAAMSVPTRANADPIQAYATNVGGWLHLLEAVHAAGLNCRLVLVSSCHVYGHSADRSEFCEDSPVRPIDVYGATRAAAETLAGVYGKRHGMQIMVARSFNHCGPRQGAEYFVASVARQAARIALSLDPPRMLLGNLDVVRDFCDVRDVARAYVGLLERGQSGQVYNVCSGKALALRTVVERLRAIAGCSFEVAAAPGLMRTVDAPRIVGDCSRLVGATGWKPRIDFDQTLRDTFDWRLAQCREDQMQGEGVAAGGARETLLEEMIAAVDAIQR